jgi:hypothetical protein
MLGRIAASGTTSNVGRIVVRTSDSYDARVFGFRCASDRR